MEVIVPPIITELRVSWSRTFTVWFLLYSIRIGKKLYTNKKLSVNC